MNLQKVLSALLLVAMTYSMVHDYAFIFHDDQHSVQEYVSQLEIPSNSDVDTDFHDTHFEYHMSYIYQPKLLSFSNMEKEETVFHHNELYCSWHTFNFLKPPIV